MYRRKTIVIFAIIILIILTGCEKEEHYEAVATIEGENFYLSSDSIHLISEYEDSVKDSYFKSYDCYLEEGLNEGEIKNKRDDRIRALRDYEIDQAIYQELLTRDMIDLGKVNLDEIKKMSRKDINSLLESHRKSIMDKEKVSEEDFLLYVEKNKENLTGYEVVSLSFSSKNDGEIFYRDLMNKQGQKEELINFLRGLDEGNLEEKRQEIKSLDLPKFMNLSLISFLDKETFEKLVFIPFGDEFNHQIKIGVKDLQIGEISDLYRSEKIWALGYKYELLFLKNKTRDIDLLEDEIKDLIKKERLNDYLLNLWDRYRVNIII